MNDCSWKNIIWDATCGVDGRWNQSCKMSLSLWIVTADGIDYGSGWSTIDRDSLAYCTRKETGFELLFSLPHADSVGAHAISAGLYVFQSWTSRGIQKRLWDYSSLKLNLTVDFACPRIPRITNLSFEEKRRDKITPTTAYPRKQRMLWRIPKNELPDSVSDGLHWSFHDHPFFLPLNNTNTILVLTNEQIQSRYEVVVKILWFIHTKSTTRCRKWWIFSMTTPTMEASR